MADIFHFSSKDKLDAVANLQRFVDDCKTELTVFGADLSWQQWRWPKAGNFTKLGAHSRTKDKADKLDDDFIDFAKAYFRYQQGHKPTEAKNELRALRAIESALLQSHQSASISQLSVAVLDQAAQLVREHYSSGAAYHGGRELERLAKFVTTKKLISQDVGAWKSPIPRKKDEIETGKKAKERREKKMPSDEALTALAEIFANNTSDPRDLFTSSTFAMTMCAPSRITEILELPVDCEVEQEDSKGVVRYGWRFYSGKGYGGDIKWIPTEMVGTAKEAISRVTRLTEEARKLARWIEQNPNKCYRHPLCPKVADDWPLTKMQACLALGLVKKDNHAAQSALSGMKLSGKDGESTLDSLWKYVLSRQPKSFPWLSKKKGIKFSNALFCMTRNQLHAQRGTSPVILWKPTNNVFNNDLSPRESAGAYHKSIFDRYGYLTPEGARIKLTSHQARHLLNTIAQRGGLLQLQIAKWSGRADVKQNRTYNHMSEYEIVAKAEELDTSLTLFGPSGVVEKHVPVTVQEFNTMERGAVHVTEFGVCVHDFVMTPCDKYRDCLNCPEQVCVKGEKGKLDRIKKRLEQVEMQYVASKQAMDDALSGADRWYEYHKNTMERLQELVAILESPDVAVGAQVKLRNDKVFSPLRRAIQSKPEDCELKHDKGQALLANMAQLLGGGFG
jgi:hypothetical protein